MIQTAKRIDPSTPTLSFIDYLETNLREAPPRLKGERTRARIKIATARMLETLGYHAMRVIDITEAAGLSEGSFYVYFTDKKEASLTTMSSFVEDFIDKVAPITEVRTPLESIRVANRRWFALCRANAGLMRCIFNLGDEEPEFAALVQNTIFKWYFTISERVRTERGYSDSGIALFAVYFMGSMMDEIIRKTIVFPDKNFLILLREIKANDDAVADAASLIWMRIFDPEAKIPRDLPPAAEKLVRLMHT